MIKHGMPIFFTKYNVVLYLYVLLLVSSDVFSAHTTHSNKVKGLPTPRLHCDDDLCQTCTVDWSRAKPRNSAYGISPSME